MLQGSYTALGPQRGLPLGRFTVRKAPCPLLDEDTSTVRILPSKSLIMFLLPKRSSSTATGAQLGAFHLAKEAVAGRSEGGRGGDKLSKWY